MGKKEAVTKIEKMSVEEKLKLLSETDKAYIRGYIDRAIGELKFPGQSAGQKNKRGKTLAE